MPQESVQRVQVWSAALRATHWLLAVGALVLLASGWVLGNLANAPAGWRDAHLTAGYLVGLGLISRLALLWRGRMPTDRWPDLVPTGRQHWQVARDMLVFYLSFGRMPLPRYYGHNPLWGPVYLVLLVALAIGVGTGLALATHDEASWLWSAATPWWLGWTLPEWHAGAAVVTGAVTGVHLLTVFWHDARGTAGEISAMVNGHKIFLVQREPPLPATRIPIMPVRDRESE